MVFRVRGEWVLSMRGSVWSEADLAMEKERVEFK